MEILLLLGLSAVTFARPDIGLGYNYRPPATSYGVPAGSVSSLHHQESYQTNQQPSGSLVGGVNSSPSASFELPIYNAGHFGAQSSQISSNLGSSIPSTLFQTAGSSLSGVSGVSGSSGLANRFEGGFQSNYQQQGRVEKHLYFFAAPDEPEVIRPRIHYPQTQSKKDVKVIFIKTPSYRIEPVQVPSQTQYEEKTKIYVLVKKPDDLHITAVPNAASQQTKPEVYFIKYSNQKEAEQAISSLQNGGSAGQNANILAGDSDLIQTIAKENSKKYDLDERYFRAGDSDEVAGGSVGLAALHQSRLKDDSFNSISGVAPSGFSGSLTVSGVKTIGKVDDGGVQSSLTAEPTASGTLQVDLSGSLGDSSTVSNVKSQVASGDSVSLATKGGFSTTNPQSQQFYLPPKSK